MSINFILVNGFYIYGFDICGFYINLRVLDIFIYLFILILQLIMNGIFTDACIFIYRFSALLKLVYIFIYNYLRVAFLFINGIFLNGVYICLCLFGYMYVFV